MVSIPHFWRNPGWQISHLEASSCSQGKTMWCRWWSEIEKAMGIEKPHPHSRSNCGASWGMPKALLGSRSTSLGPTKCGKSHVKACIKIGGLKHLHNWGVCCWIYHRQNRACCFMTKHSKTTSRLICRLCGKRMLVGGWATPLKNMKVNWDD